MSPSRLQQFLRGGQGGHGQPVSSTPATQAALEKEKAVSRPLGMAIDLATKLMDAHGLVGWRIKLDHARTTPVSIKRPAFFLSLIHI